MIVRKSMGKVVKSRPSPTRSSYGNVKAESFKFNNKRQLIEEDEEDFDNFYDDQLDDLGDYTSDEVIDEVETESVIEDGDINKKLNIIIKKLAKLEEMVSNLSGREVNVKVSEDLSKNDTVNAPTTQPKTSGSMLREIQETLGTQMPMGMDGMAMPQLPGSGLGQMSQGTMNMQPQMIGSSPMMQQPSNVFAQAAQMVDNSMSTIATMPSGTYDDDV